MSQIAGGIVTLNISQITNTSGGQLTGGENIIRAMLTQSIDVSNTLDLGSVGDQVFQVLILFFISFYQISETKLQFHHLL